MQLSRIGIAFGIASILFSGYLVATNPFSNSLVFSLVFSLIGPQSVIIAFIGLVLCSISYIQNRRRSDLIFSLICLAAVALALAVPNWIRQA
jgi:hypothetical protein